jgi:hypothetical protein
VTSPPLQTTPYFALPPNPTYTLFAGSSLDLIFDIYDKEGDEFTIQVDLRKNEVFAT